MMKSSRIILAVAAVFFAVLPLNTTARDVPPGISEMWTVVPKADQRAEFFKALKEHMAFRSEAGDPRVWNTYTPTLGDEIDLVALRACCFHWADADTYRDWGEANPEVGKHWEENVAPHVASYGHYFDQVSWENTNIEKSWGPYRYYIETKFYLKPGMASEFDAARDQISQIALNQGWASEEHPWIWATEIGGTPTESIVVPMKKMGDMEPAGESFFNFMSRVLGSDEAAEELFSKLAGTVDRQETQIWELHEDLSMKRPD